MAPARPALPCAYRQDAAVDPFYAGGPLAQLPDGRVATAYSDEVKV